MFDLWWMSGDDETEPTVVVACVALVGSTREALASGREHARANPGLGGRYRLCNAAGDVLAQFEAREGGTWALPLDPYAEEQAAYARAG